VDQSIRPWTGTDEKIFVICPIPILVEKKERTQFYKSGWLMTSPRGVLKYIYYPRVFSALNRRFLVVSIIAAADHSFCQAVLAFMRFNKLALDILYAHFITTIMPLS